ncbi:hypothetical protein [Microcystis aeruginosa]|uniref:Uncharacterized protein n=1 Tax=Microcystis aeruginosa NIES-3807 TaxID=2517785 RepID=A0AAD3GAI1_MICAE|nr:hypothetical protein [Microcystis aeruginosa]GCL60800.1 hypothetical protein NIES3807_39850 [Microcystis aeruginosa NIES-3807]
MSKVISFSISDRYLDKLRTLYPALTDNLAAKQFITDGLESSLGSSLDGSLDDGLDGRVKSIIETSLDGILEGRLDAVVGKLISDLSERLSRLEKRLDTNLDGRLDDMERLLKLQRESSIASPLPPIEETSPLPPSPPDRPAIETVTPEVSPSPPGAIASIDGTVETVEPISTIETVASAIEDSEKKIVDSLDTSIASKIGIDKSGSEPGTDAINSLPGDTSPIETVTGEGMNPNQAHEYLKKRGIEDTSYYYLNKWAKTGVIDDTSPQGRDALKHLILRGKLYFPKTDQPRLK